MTTRGDYFVDTSAVTDEAAKDAMVLSGAVSPDPLLQGGPSTQTRSTGKRSAQAQFTRSMQEFLDTHEAQMRYLGTAGQAVWQQLQNLQEQVQGSGQILDKKARQEAIAQKQHLESLFELVENNQLLEAERQLRVAREEREQEKREQRELLVQFKQSDDVRNQRIAEMEERLRQHMSVAPSMVSAPLDPNAPQAVPVGNGKKPENAGPVGGNAGPVGGNGGRQPEDAGPVRGNSGRGPVGAAPVGGMVEINLLETHQEEIEWSHGRKNWRMNRGGNRNSAPPEDDEMVDSLAKIPVRDAYQTTRVHYAELRVRLTATKVEVSKISSVNVEYDSP
ncbi:uncharacterized protein H6S33_001732 [Morchella sextelata]|uniref:uncharacterized protein n=1 Tax=Morchella sextelata TaxID=1174677 RepID=UPI001D054FF2|nr:uncharacterized protein H6S33_001732 [Morchella sextelata]KAH0608598.1 hypothetical protein H6S33_001732 [Morchella sextelata]